MSHEIIIIDRLLEIPSLPPTDQDCLRQIKEHIREKGKCSAKDARKAATIVQRVLLSE